MFSSKSWCVAVVVLVVCVVGGPAEAQPYIYALGRNMDTPRRNVLTVINGATNAKGPSISLGASRGTIQPHAMVMAPGGDRIYVINDLDFTVSVVSTETNTVVETWPEALVGANPRALAVSPDGQRIYVVGNHQLFIAIDAASRSRVATVTHNLGGTFGVAASPDGSRVYIMATGSDTLAVLSTAPYGVIATVPLDLEARVLSGNSVSLSPDGRFAYLPQFSPSGSPWVCPPDIDCVSLTPPAGVARSRVSVLDTTTNAIVAMTTVEGYAYHVGVSPNGAVVYAPNYTYWLHRLSPTTHASVGRTAVPTGRAVAFSADSTRGYVATNDSVAVIDTASHTVVSTIPFVAATDGVPNAIVTTPPEPPGPASNLRATVAGNRVSLSWDPASGAVAGYVLEGGVGPGEVMASLPTGQSAPAFTFDAPTGAFYIRIHAVGAGGRSPASNEIQILVNVPQPPSAPAHLRGLVDGSNLALSWTTSFTGGQPTSLLLDVSGPVTTTLPLPLSESFEYSGVPPGTYTFTVRGVNGAGSSSASTPVTLTFPGTCPGAPQAPTNFVVTRAGSQLSVSWDPPSAGPAVSTYVLEVTGALNLTLPLPTRSASGTVPSGAYNLSVRAVNPCGSGVATAPQSVTVP